LKVKSKNLKESRFVFTFYFFLLTLMNKDQNVEVSDTTKLNSSTSAKYKKLHFKLRQIQLRI